MKEDERYREGVSKRGHGVYKPCETSIEEAPELGMMVDTEMDE